jgi:hypothetical protein
MDKKILTITSELDNINVPYFEIYDDNTKNQVIDFYNRLPDELKEEFKELVDKITSDGYQMGQGLPGDY